MLKTQNFDWSLLQVNNITVSLGRIDLCFSLQTGLSHPKTISVPGFLGKYKIEGTVDIKMQSGLVSFTDGVTNKHRTIVKM